MKELFEFRLQSRNFAKISLCLKSLERGQAWRPAAVLLGRSLGTASERLAEIFKEWPVMAEDLFVMAQTSHLENSQTSMSFPVGPLSLEAHKIIHPLLLWPLHSASPSPL